MAEESKENAFLTDPISLFEMNYDTDFIVEIERKSGNIIHIK